MKNRNLIYVFSIFILVHLFVETVWSQQTESVHIYNKQGDKILYKCNRAFDDAQDWNGYTVSSWKELNKLLNNIISQEKGYTNGKI